MLLPKARDVMSTYLQGPHPILRRNLNASFTNGKQMITMHDPGYKEVSVLIYLSLHRFRDRVTWYMDILVGLLVLDLVMCYFINIFSKECEQSCESINPQTWL